MAGIWRTRCTRWGHCSLLKPKYLTVMPSASKVTVFEMDKKAGYNTKIEIPLSERLKFGWKEFGPELGKFKEEVLAKFRCDQIYDREHLDYEYFTKFDSLKTVDKWVATSDSDHLEGKSMASFILNKYNHGLFHGNISNEVPKDGIIKRAGYCHLRSPRNMLSFKRYISYDWSRYNYLVMRVRGDGRPYLFTIGMDAYFDINWSDQYNFTLYTRGGPYWQTSKIPFSKFFRTAKGRIQDRQERIQLDRISFFGITQGDGNEGPFHLEIDYIALMFDENLQENFAYETYEVTPYTSGV